ncbi:MAG: hypothetical protein K9M45_03415 [Kiritimatiellales bacterium]|nr:hypothetical protein [Kiritimatiellales bacterium]
MKLRKATVFVCLCIMGLSLTSPCRAKDIIDDFSEGGWKATNKKAPATVTAKKGSLLLIDHSGGGITWGTSCSKKYKLVDLRQTPYLVFEVKALTGTGYSAKVSGGKERPKKTIMQGTSLGVVAVDLLRATKWKADTGPLTLSLYVQGDGKQVEYGFVKFSAELTTEEEAALIKPPAKAPALIALAARTGKKPKQENVKEGERSVYRDPVTGHEIWRMTDHPAIERHVYYDIPAWNANGSTLYWRARRPGAKMWLMDADGTNFRPLPKAGDGGKMTSLYWSRTDTNRMYFARSDAKETAVYTLDIRNGGTAKLVSIPLPETVGELGFREFAPPHPDERYFLFRWGRMDKDPTLVVVVDSETGKFWKLETGTTVHRLRFTKTADHSVFINSNYRPDELDTKDRLEWVLQLDGSRHGLLPLGGHPDWNPAGTWGAGYRDGGIWLVSHDGKTERELVKTSSGHGGFSITTGAWHVGDSPKSGPYGNMVFVTEIATGKVVPISCHGSSYSGWGSGVSDPEATHPAPVCSPDETKIVYDSDMLGQPDVWVAVWKRPQAPRNVQFKNGTLSWKEPELHREVAGYVLYRKDNSNWNAMAGKRVEGLSLQGLEAGTYAVAAQEWSGLTSPLAVADCQETLMETTAPPAPGAATPLNSSKSCVVLGLPDVSATDFSHYNVYATDAEPSLETLVGSPRLQRFVDWGLTPETRRSYRVTITDRHGNESLPGPVLRTATKNR